MNKTRYWMLQGQLVTPCTKAVWEKFRSNSANFMMAKTHLEPGFLIQTQFIGREFAAHGPVLFKTSVFSDLGESIRLTRTHEEAVTMHQMECQRIAYIVDRNQWSMTAEASDYDV